MVFGLVSVVFFGTVFFRFLLSMDFLILKLMLKVILPGLIYINFIYFFRLNGFGLFYGIMKLKCVILWGKFPLRQNPVLIHLREQVS